MVAASSCLLCELGGVGLLRTASEIGDDNRVRVKAGTISGSPQELIPTGFTLTLPLGADGSGPT